MVQHGARSRAGTISAGLVMLVGMLVAGPAGVGAVSAAETTPGAGASGTVTAWGYNAFGQAPDAVGLTDVTAIAAGGSHSLALHADGTVTAWGRNTEG